MGEALVEIGHAGAGFSFDNERPRHKVWLGPYALADRLVTVAEYMEFMEDGGYQRPDLWLAEGWDWRQREGVEAPLYWERDGETWYRAGLCGFQPLRPHLPVAHVSYYEADAFAQWTSFRLATEFEWEHAANGSPLEGSFLDRGHLQASAATGKGLRQLYGELWQWTSSPYTGYPGYRVAQGALGEYNGKFMSNQMVLRGASCVTPRSHARLSYRNFFAPHCRWHFGGIRLARDL
jgi:ergothioneine biosynthesis protein EgtB